MRMRITSCDSRKVLKIVAAGFLASATAACGSDSSRFSENPFTNPFAASSAAKVDPATTASIPARAAPIGSVSSRPLPPATLNNPPGPSLAQPQPRLASSAPQQPSPVTGSAAGWTASGGTPVMVGAGETASTLSTRYGVPIAAINAANGGQIRSGQQAIIPIYSGNGSAPKTVLTEPARTAAPASRPSQPAIVATKPAQPAKAAKPATSDDDDEDEVKPKKIIAASPKADVAVLAARPVKAPEQVATVQPKQAPRVIPLTAPKAEEPAPKLDATTTASIPVQKPPLATEEKADFRWPARGRIISGFGSKGGNGDGIAIAVPEGTPVKAAADGVVAYAGEELKGYGKLVLVRHENGYVTAYAHNGDLNVKRGEKVTRGQTIAKSGATGNVTSPQLHFELRKGSTPVDPTKFLDN